MVSQEHAVINTMIDDYLNAKQVRCSKVVMAADFDFSIPYFLTNLFIKTVVVKLWKHLFLDLYNLDRFELLDRYKL